MTYYQDNKERQKRVANEYYHRNRDSILAKIKAKTKRMKKARVNAASITKLEIGQSYFVRDKAPGELSHHHAIALYHGRKITAKRVKGGSKITRIK